jgi:hypothetical protein
MERLNADKRRQIINLHKLPMPTPGGGQNRRQEFMARVKKNLLEQKPQEVRNWLEEESPAIPEQAN